MFGAGVVERARPHSEGAGLRLDGAQGNHGEDVKDYWWYLDALPSHAWNSWRYHYPQRAFPYQQLLDENRRRGKFDLEYELLDTGVFDDDRYWVVDVDYAKASPFDLLMTIRVTNAGLDASRFTFKVPSGVEVIKK